jgi:hypothetical protein
MDTSPSCRSSRAANRLRTSGRLWLGVANALAIELGVALAVALLAAFLGGDLPC